MNRFTIIIFLTALTALLSCSHREEPAKEQSIDLNWGIAIHTTEAKMDTLGEECGICVVNEALSYTLDAITLKALTDNHFRVQDCNGSVSSVWIKQDSCFIRKPVTCGYSDGKKTIITTGLDSGDEVVSFIRVNRIK